jgi:SpoVK/Ycf46/Vps4 family AAA+-type ATPase
MINLEFNPGDIVKFVGVEKVGDRVPDFQAQGVAPSSEFRTNGGSAAVGERYFRDYGLVTWTGNAYYMVAYSDEYDNEVRLAFSKTKLQLVRTESDKGKIDYTKLDRIVIAEDVREEIISVLKQHKNADKLFEEWGLGEIMEYGRGMGFMFYGPPGTGKTGMAHAIAASLGSELQIISAAEIQSSEPGGANRNIQQAFANAKQQKKVLFIDECDSLITSRADLGMILASEVNTLLTEIEKFEGVCILATNRIEHMDEALERRISLIVEFPNPNAEQRLAIWKKLLPSKMPLADNVNIEKLAKLELTGGQIKNAILSAARLASSDESNKVSLANFEKAITRITKSKNLMGSASRYMQGFREDLQKGPSGRVNKEKSISSFLDIEARKIKDADLDIDTNK